MTKVFWTDAELLQVGAAVDASQQRGEASGNAQQAWDAAQRVVLPEERWRPFSSSASNAKKAYLELRSSLPPAEVDKLVGVEPEPEPEPDTDLLFIEGAGVLKPEAYAAVLAHHAANNPPAPPPQPKLAEVLTGLVVELLDEVITAALQRLEHRLAEHTTQRAEPAAPHRPYIKRQPTMSQPSKPVVILVNANSVQTEAVQTDFPMLDVRMVDGKVPGEADPELVIGFTKFMSHPLEHALKKKYKDTYMPLRGGASDAKRQLGVIFKELVHHHHRHHSNKEQTS